MKPTRPLRRLVQRKAGPRLQLTYPSFMNYPSTLVVGILSIVAHRIALVFGDPVYTRNKPSRGQASPLGCMYSSSILPRAATPITQISSVPGHLPQVLHLGFAFRTILPG